MEGGGDTLFTRENIPSNLISVPSLSDFAVFYWIKSSKEKVLLFLQSSLNQYCLLSYPTMKSVMSIYLDNVLMSVNFNMKAV